MPACIDETTEMEKWSEIYDQLAEQLGKLNYELDQGMLSSHEKVKLEKKRKEVKRKFDEASKKEDEAIKKWRECAGIPE